jgi:hypothetical protein
MYSQLTEKTNCFIDACLTEGLKPIFIILPSKKNFGLSLSARLLKKFWLDDLNNQPISFNQGDIINITIPPRLISNKNSINLLVKVEAINGRSITVSCRPDDTNTRINLNVNWLYKYGEKSTKSKPLSTSENFKNKFNELKKADINNNPWSQFLGINDTVTKAQLSSKVYFIAGRGNVEDSREFIEKVGLRDVLNDGLIVEESLKNFVECIEDNKKRLEKTKSFIQVFNAIFPSDFKPEKNELKEIFVDISEKLRQNNIEITELKSVLNHFLDELNKNGFTDKHQSLYNIIKILPEVTSNDFQISSVKSVLINGTELTTTYASTISALLNRKIPVIILSDYANYTKKRKELITNFHRDFPVVFCLNWDKIKINTLNEIDADNQYLDKEAYNFCKKYLNQRVNIEAFNDDTNIIDKFFNAFEICKLLHRIEGFEGIKNAYTIHLRPVVYWVKNIPGSVEFTKDIIEAVNSFQETYDLIRSLLYAQEPNIVNLLEEFLTLFINKGGTINNSKTLDNLPVHSMYFEQTFDTLAEKELPLTNCQLENLEIQTLVFTGTPYEEVKQFYLRKAIFEDFENVYFTGFCKEAENVYLRFVNDTISFNRRIHDILPDNYFPFWESIVELESDVTYLNEKCSEYKNEAEPINEDVDVDFDEVQDLIELARYQVNDRDDYSVGYTDKDTKVLVNILELDGNKSVFIKKTGARKLLVLKKNKNIDKADWDDINLGDRVFTYVITRHDTLEMRGENTVDASVFQDLDIWYERLKVLYENFNRNYTDLAKRLNDLKIENNLQGANPEPSNLRNWLNKDRIINAPERENLRLILLAAATPDITAETKKIRNAKKKVEKLDRSNREDIKTKIQKHIKKYDIEGADSFSIIVNSVPIAIKHGIVKHKIEPDNLKMDQDKIGIIISL